MLTIDATDQPAADINKSVTQESNSSKLTQLTAATVATSVAGLLAACGGGGDNSTGSDNTVPVTTANESGVLPSSNNNATATSISAKQAVRFLTQAQFSASDAEVAEVQSKGYSAWLDQQFKASSSSQTAWDWLIANGFNSERYNGNGVPADSVVWMQLITSTDAVRKRVALALSEIFVVSTNGVPFHSVSFFTAAYWDLLLANAFGNYRTLLEAVTLSPAMGCYLNTEGNHKFVAATGRQPDENYGREVMQLFSIGLNQLNIDGTVKLNAAGQPIPTYGQDDVVNIARMFTGWSFDRSQGGEGNNISPMFAKLPMVFNSSRHSPEEAKFLGVTVPANTDGKAALKTTLDTLFNHPNVGPFICRQLIQRLVTSHPSPAYVARVASVFNRNSSGERGNLQSVVRAILLDDEARNSKGLTQATFGRIREPMVRYIQWARTFKARPLDGNWQEGVGNTSNPASSLGQSPLRSPSVFNFYRPGYVPTGADIAKEGLTVPEFQIVNEVSVAGYVNTMQYVVSNGSSLKADYSAELALVNDPAALVKRLILLLSADQIGQANQSAIQKAITTIDARSAAGKNNRLFAALTLVLSAPEYIVQK